VASPAGPDGLVLREDLVPCTLLIRATDGPPGGLVKGEPGGSVYDLPHEWGAKEGLPNWVQLTISDATASQVEHFLFAWKIDYTFSIVSETFTGGLYGAGQWRVTVEVDPALISASGTGQSELKTEMQTWVTSSFTDPHFPGAEGSVVTFTTSSMTIDTPKPTDPTEQAERLPALKRLFTDRFEHILDVRRYYFLDTDVDAAVAAGGTITRTRAQALALVQDKLDD
jgi:hypothetical protein